MRKICLLPADRSGCGLYRMILPGRAVAHVAPDLEITSKVSLTGEVRNGPQGPYVHMLPQLPYDVMIFQRPFMTVVSQCIPLAQRQGIACVVELDDDVRNIDPKNGAFDGVQPKNNTASNWKNIVDACAVADWVTVSTPALTSYAPHGRVSVIPNAVPRSMTTHEIVRDSNAPVTVGWAGALVTHRGDLEETCGQVAAVVEQTGARFHVVGDGADVQEALRLSDKPTASGWKPLTEYPQALTALDVGIVPLAPTQFNKAKSYLKGLEMAALGIPFVASPLPEYVHLAEDYGIGVIAHRPKDWMREVKRLIVDRGYRLETGALYRQRVQDSLLIEHTAPLWLDAWDSAFAWRRQTQLARAHG